MTILGSWVRRDLTDWFLYQFLTGNRMVPFSDTRYLCNFRLFDVGVPYAGSAAAVCVDGWPCMVSVTEDAKCERGRISKIRARHYLENHESYNFYYSTFCVMSTVRRTSGPANSHPTSTAPTLFGLGSSQGPSQGPACSGVCFFARFDCALLRYAIIYSTMLGFPMFCHAVTCSGLFSFVAL